MANQQGSTPSLDTVRLHRAGVRAAADEVERAVAVAAHGRAPHWAASVTEALARLRDAFEHHIAVTEADTGLFAEVVGAAPRLSHRTEELRRDHQAIRQAIAGALASLKGLDDEGVAGVREEVVGILGRIVRHRSKGAELVYDTWSVDIEAAD